MTAHARQRCIERYGSADSYDRILQVLAEDRMQWVTDTLIKGQWVGHCRDREGRHLYACIAPDGGIVTVFEEGMDVSTPLGRVTLSEGEAVFYE